MSIYQASSRSDHPRRMGLSRRNRQQRHRAGAQAHLRQAAARVSQHADPRLGPLCRPARRADGQQRSGPPEHRRRPHCADGHYAHRRADRVRRVPERTRPSCRPCSGRARAGGNCISSAWSPTAACTRTRSTSTRCCAPRASTALERVFVHAFMDGRDTRPTSGAGYIAQLEQKMREYGVGKVASDQRPLLRHGPRQALGARAQGLRRHGERQGRGRRVSRMPWRASRRATTTASPTSF